MSTKKPQGKGKGTKLPVWAQNFLKAAKDGDVEALKVPFFLFSLFFFFHFLTPLSSFFLKRISKDDNFTVDETDGAGRTALHFAAAGNHIEGFSFFSSFFSFFLFLFFLFVFFCFFSLTISQKLPRC